MKAVIAANLLWRVITEDTVRNWELVRIFTAKAVIDFLWRMITRDTVQSFF